MDTRTGNLSGEADRLIAEFRAATDGILTPDPKLGALICAAYQLDGELPPLRLYKGAA
jgi:hypothetical protein